MDSGKQTPSNRTSFYRDFGKRALDLTCSAILLLVLLPMFLILTAADAVIMRGNPFFIQKRPGRIDKKTGTERIFKLIKFRTMTNERDAEGRLLPDKDRLGGFGRLMRALSLDELPELLNILRGDMSFVGPRPLLVEYLPWYTPEERRRHEVRPGLTGYAQVNGRNSLEWGKRFRLDVEYVDRVSLAFDLKILGKTVKSVLSHKDVAEDTNVTEGNFAKIRQAQMERRDALSEEESHEYLTAQRGDEK